MSKRRNAALVVVTAVLGCASYPVSTTIVAQPGKRVTAQASKFSFLWLSPLPMETAGNLLDDLLRQCNGADLTGVTIASERGWVVVGETMKIIVSGYCVDPSRGGRDDGEPELAHMDSPPPHPTDLPPPGPAPGGAVSGRSVGAGP